MIVFMILMNIILLTFGCEENGEIEIPLLETKVQIGETVAEELVRNQSEIKLQMCEQDKIVRKYYILKSYEQENIIYFKIL